jgi:hypothetical protein
LLHSIPRQELGIKALGRVSLAFESGEYELVQQQNGVAKRGEMLEVEGYI